jgi:hypothetical protein
MCLYLIYMKGKLRRVAGNELEKKSERNERNKESVKFQLNIRVI